MTQQGFSTPPLPHDGPASARLSGTNLERAGDHNQRVVLQAIRIHGPITRGELATLSGLTAPAIANITRRLQQEGLIADAGQRRGGRGQPATRFVVNPQGRLSVGVNVDRDHVTVVVLDLLGVVLARESREADLASPEETAATVGAMVGAALAAAALPRDRLIGAGVALPDDLSSVDLPHRRHLEAWRTVNVAALFGDALGLAVEVENDAAAAAIGELHFGHGLRHLSFFYMLITAGLGGGLVVEGDYFRGATGRSGEIGFLPLHRPGLAARTLQDAVSLSALYDHLAAQGRAVSSPAELARLDAAGQALVDGWIEAAADILIEPLMAVCWLVNPAAILLGGRLPLERLDDLAARLTARLAAKAAEMPTLTPILRAATAEDAPAIGAAILPFLQQLLPSRTTLMKTGEA